MLKEHKATIAWFIADIKGISSAICMHKIITDDSIKPVVQPLHCVNPNFKVVVRKEVLKLLSAGVIYPISNSEWVCPVQVVPKKGGITVIKNIDDELLPTRVQIAW